MPALAFDRDPRRGRSPVTLARIVVLGAVVLVGFIIWTMLGAQIVTDRPNEMKTTTVMLPPPPPPPPPPEVKPVETPPKPIDVPPLDKPQDTPPTPDAPQKSSDPAPGDAALTAREGAGPTNYGLARGDGSGLRIGGRPGGGGGGDAFASYASVALSAIRLATQGDRELARGRYTTQLALTVNADGRITEVRLLGSSGDGRRDARLRQLLTGLQLSRRPPPGLPVMRVELNARAGA